MSNSSPDDRRAELEQILYKNITSFQAVSYEDVADAIMAWHERAASERERRAELKGIKKYAKNCRILRMEPSTYGMDRFIKAEEERLEALSQQKEANHTNGEPYSKDEPESGITPAKEDL